MKTITKRPIETFKTQTSLVSILKKQFIQAAIWANRRNISRMDNALVWEIKQGMSMERFISANKQAARMKKKLYARIDYWEKRLTQ